MMSEIEVYKRKARVFDFVRDVVLCRVTWEKKLESSTLHVEAPKGTWHVPDLSAFTITTATYSDGERVVHLATHQEQGGAYRLLVDGKRYALARHEGGTTLLGPDGPMLVEGPAIWKDSELGEGLKWRLLDRNLPECPLGSLFLGLWLLPLYRPNPAAPGYRPGMM